MPVRNYRDGILVIQDGASPTPAEITVAHEQGNLQWGITQNHQVVLDRGALDSRRAGDDAPVEGSCTLNHVQLSSDLSDTVDEEPTLYEILNQLADADDWESTAAAGEEFAVRFIFWVLNPDTSGLDEKIVFEAVALSSFQFQEAAEANSEAYTWQDFETRPTITREAYS